MSELKREKMTEIKKEASKYYGQIKAEKKRLSSDLGKYEKVAASLASSVSKYERAMKKYDKKSTEKNRLAVSSAKDGAMKSLNAQGDAARKINSSIEYINGKYIAIGDMLAAVKKNGARVPERQRASFLRGIAAQLEDATALLSNVNIPEFDMENVEVASPVMADAGSEKVAEERSAHTIYGGVTDARLALKHCLRNCKKFAGRLVRSGKKYLKVKAKKESGRGVNIDARLQAKREAYLNALAKYNDSAAEMNLNLDLACDHYEELRELLSVDRKKASARVAREYERCIKSTTAKVSKIKLSMKKLGIPSAK